MTPQRFARLKSILEQRQPDLTVVTDGVHKSHNVSAILRTCDAVGVRRLHAVAASGTMPSHHMIAGGSRRWVDIIVETSIAATYARLREQGFRILVAHAGSGSIDYRSCDYTGRTAIVLGAELTGPSESAILAADDRVAIPIRGMVESLNVSVAAAVVLYEAERQKAAAGHYSVSRIDEPEYSTTLFEWAHPDIARRCREAGLPYPAMTVDGDLIENPFAKRRPGRRSE